MTHSIQGAKRHDFQRSAATAKASPGGSRVFNERTNSTRDFEIVIANYDPSLLAAADMLVMRRYAGKGLSLGNGIAGRKNDNSVTLAAIRDGRVVAAITARGDGPAGLLAESLYEREIAHARLSGARLCELTRLAADPSFNSQAELVTLFNAAYRIATSRFGATDFFMEVHPRHAAYYRRMVGCQIVGVETTCPRVNAPAVLLHLPARRVEDRMQIATMRKSVGEKTRRSVYGYLQRAACGESLGRDWASGLALAAS